MAMRLKEHRSDDHTIGGMFQDWKDDRKHEAAEQVRWLKTGAMKVALAAGLTIMIMVLVSVIMSL
jgi:hypothetical protein